MAQNFSSTSRFSVQRNIRVFVKQSDSVNSCRAIKKQFKYISRFVFPFIFFGQHACVDAYSVLPQKTQKLREQIESTTQPKARFVFRDIKIAVTVDDSAPKISRFEEVARRDPTKTFFAQSVTCKRFSEGVRTNSETRLGENLAPYFAAVTSDFVLRLQEQFEFFKMPYIPQREAYGQRGATDFSFVERAISEEKADPIGRLWRDCVECIFSMEEFCSRIGLISHRDTKRANRIADVISADPNGLGYFRWSFTGDKSIFDSKLLFSSQPNSTFCHEFIVAENLKSDFSTEVA